MGSEHTPGPWHAWEEHEGIYAGELLVNAPDRIQMVEGTGRGKVAEACEMDDDDPSDDSDDFSIGRQQRANARLIAAAPDLLAALEAMLKAVEGVPVGPEKQARAAIARARGTALGGEG